MAKTIDFTLGKCKTRAGFSAKLRQPDKLDLRRVKEHFMVVLDTPVLLVVNVQGVEVIVHGYGELLFKECDDMLMMEKIAEEIYEVGLRKKN